MPLRRQINIVKENERDRKGEHEMRSLGPHLHKGIAAARTISAFGVWLLVIASCGAGAVWIVDGSGGGDFVTINGAVGAAAPGDTVLIHPGLYGESVKISPEKSGLWLVGEGGAENVIIEGDTVAIGIWHADPAVHIQGLTITGGNILGGLYTMDSKAEVKGCIFRNNVGPGACNGVGGAIDAILDSDLLIENCTIEDNTGWEAPGGVIIWQSHADIRRNIFRRNQACYGGGLEIYHCATQPVSYVEENIFVDNSVTAWGGAIFTVDSSPTIRQNTFFANDAPGNAAIWVLGGQPVITKNVVVGSDWGIYCQTDPQYPPSLPIVDCNLLWDPGLGVSFDCSNMGRVIEQDPLFCDPASENFALCEDSPAISDSCGPLGALGSGCQPCAAQVTPTSWGAIKAMHK
jgi:hypothetical protein